jgi:hypothetical protein
MTKPTNAELIRQNVRLAKDYAVALYEIDRLQRKIKRIKEDEKERDEQARDRTPASNYGLVL